jgi:hypothetical protein
MPIASYDKAAPLARRLRRALPWRPTRRTPGHAQGSPDQHGPFVTRSGRTATASRSEIHHRYRRVLSEHHHILEMAGVDVLLEARQQAVDQYR